MNKEDIRKGARIHKIGNNDTVYVIVEEINRLGFQTWVITNEQNVEESLCESSFSLEQGYKIVKEFDIPKSNNVLSLEFVKGLINSYQIVFDKYWPFITFKGVTYKLGQLPLS